MLRGPNKSAHVPSGPSLQHKKIAMGLSHVAGWGAFLREPARKNELIGEYTGELVDQEEAERRCAQAPPPAAVWSSI